MSEAGRNALIFLINALFDTYLFVLSIRLILSWVSADYHNPLTQFVVTCTQVIIKPLRRYLPNIRDLETSTLVLMIALELVKFFVITLISFGFPNLLGLVLLAFADTVKLILLAFFYAIILQAILSFLQPSPLSHVLQQITSPILSPLRRVIPLISGFDVTPIPALIILQLINIFLINPLLYVALSMTVS